MVHYGIGYRPKKEPLPSVVSVGAYNYQIRTKILGRLDDPAVGGTKKQLTADGCPGTSRHLVDHGDRAVQNPLGVLAGCVFESGGVRQKSAVDVDAYRDRHVDHADRFDLIFVVQ